MKHILTERLRLSVPDIGNLAGQHMMLEIELAEAGRHPSPAERASALSDYGALQPARLRQRVRFSTSPNLVIKRDEPEMVGVIFNTINLDAFTTAPDGQRRRAGPLELGIRVMIWPMHCGRGYGIEAARAFSDYVSCVLRAQRLVAEADDDDPHALRLMARLGMFVQPALRP